VSPNGLPLEQEIRVISHFFIRLGKRRHEDSDSDEEGGTRKKEKQTRE